MRPAERGSGGGLLGAELSLESGGNSSMLAERRGTWRNEVQVVPAFALQIVAHVLEIQARHDRPGNPGRRPRRRHVVEEALGREVRGALGRPWSDRRREIRHAARGHGSDGRHEIGQPARGDGADGRGEIHAARGDGADGRGKIDTARGDGPDGRGKIDAARGDRSRRGGKIDAARGDRSDRCGKIDAARGDGSDGGGKIDAARGNRSNGRGEIDATRGDRSDGHREGVRSPSESTSPGSAGVGETCRGSGVTRAGMRLGAGRSMTAGIARGAGRSTISSPAAAAARRASATVTVFSWPQFRHFNNIPVAGICAALICFVVPHFAQVVVNIRC